MSPKTSVARCGLAALAIMGALVCTLPSQAALVAHYTFDDVDTTKTGDGSMGDPFQIDVADATGNGKTARNTSTQEQNGNPGVYGALMITGEPGKFGQSHKFFRDPSIFPTGGGDPSAKPTANGTYYVDDGAAPIGADPRGFSLWFNQEVDTSPGQDKLFGYGQGFPGEAFDIGLEGGGIRLRHFDGNITYGSGFDFQATGADAGWHHLVVRVDNGASTFADIDVFLDNTQLTVSATEGNGLSTTIDTLGTLAPPPVNPDGFGIGTTSIVDSGSNNAAQNGFQGWLDQFRIYDHALIAQEITDLFNEAADNADFDDDNDVDIADLMIWQRGYGLAGQTDNTQGDADGNGTVDDDDLVVWQGQFGTGEALSGIASGVPEPTTAVLLLCGFTAFGRFTTYRRPVVREEAK